MYHWVVTIKEFTHQGEFSVELPAISHWEFTGNVKIDDRGVIMWETRSPAGVLMKYPCGTKRFIAQYTLI